jgi:hypothetical protein
VTLAALQMIEMEGIQWKTEILFESLQLARRATNIINQTIKSLHPA